jgi:L-threonylcarbamoyladenylate synthase
VEVLEAGGIVVHPTETIYGIGGNCTPENNALISRVKLRGADQPLLLLTPDLDALRSAFGDLDWPPETDTLVENFWPGPLTVVVGCPGAPKGLVGPGGGIAVRVSPDPTIAAIMRRWRRPMTSTSANLAGCEAPRSLDQALQVFDGRNDLADIPVPVLAIDAGTTNGTTPSTIISFVESPPELLREGLVTREQIEPWLVTSRKL